MGGSHPLRKKDSGTICIWCIQRGEHFGPSVDSDEEILEWVRRDGETAYHPSCSCAMGTGTQSVVDPKILRFMGWKEFVSWMPSTMPYVPNANINAPTLMLAEKAADLILQKHPYPSKLRNFIGLDPYSLWINGELGKRIHLVKRFFLRLWKSGFCNSGRALRAEWHESEVEIKRKTQFIKVWSYKRQDKNRSCLILNTWINQKKMYPASSKFYTHNTRSLFGWLCLDSLYGWFLNS